MVPPKAASLRIKSALRGATEWASGYWAASFLDRCATPLLAKKSPKPEDPDDLAQTPASQRRCRNGRRVSRPARRRAGYGQDRPDRAHDRPAGLDRQAD